MPYYSGIILLIESMPSPESARRQEQSEEKGVESKPKFDLEALSSEVAEPKIDIDFEKALEGAAKGLLENPEVKEKVDELFNDLFKKKKKKK